MKIDKNERTVKYGWSRFWGLLFVALATLALTCSRPLFGVQAQYNCHVLATNACVAIYTACQAQTSDGTWSGQVIGATMQPQCAAGRPGNSLCYPTNSFYCGYDCFYYDELTQSWADQWQTNKVSAYDLGGTNCMYLSPILTKVQHLACIQVGHPRPGAQRLTPRS